MYADSYRLHSSVQQASSEKRQIGAVNVLIIRSRLSPSLATIRHILVIQSIQFQPVQQAGGMRGGSTLLPPSKCVSRLTTEK